MRTLEIPSGVLRLSLLCSAALILTGCGCDRQALTRFPMYPKLQVERVEDVEQNCQHIVVAYSEDAADAVEGYYRRELQESGWTLLALSEEEKLKSLGPGEPEDSRVLHATKATRVFLVVLSRRDDGTRLRLVLSTPDKGV